MTPNKAQKSMAVPPKVEGAERWITMTNALIRSGHGLTLGEKRIVMLAASKLDSMMTCAPGEVPTTKISAIEYAEMYGIEMNAAYDPKTLLQIYHEAVSEPYAFLYIKLM